MAYERSFPLKPVHILSTTSSDARYRRFVASCRASNSDRKEALDRLTSYNFFVEQDAATRMAVSSTSQADTFAVRLYTFWKLSTNSCTFRQNSWVLPSCSGKMRLRHLAHIFYRPCRPLDQMYLVFSGGWHSTTAILYPCFNSNHDLCWYFDKISGLVPPQASIEYGVQINITIWTRPLNQRSIFSIVPTSSIDVFSLPIGVERYSSRHQHHSLAAAPTDKSALPNMHWGLFELEQLFIFNAILQIAVAGCAFARIDLHKMLYSQCHQYQIRHHP